jgi:LysR family nitrogen assimilation transcriptional regulator
LKHRVRKHQGSIDIALIPTVEPSADMHLTLLARESLVLVGPADAGLSLSRPVTLLQLLERPLISSAPANSLRKVLDAAAAKARRAPRIRVETNLAETALSLVAAGQGFGSCPPAGCCTSYAKGNSPLPPLQGLTIEWKLARGRNLASSPLVRVTEEILVQHVARLLAEDRWATAIRSRNARTKAVS